jgi:hypothetical protein
LVNRLRTPTSRTYRKRTPTVTKILRSQTWSRAFSDRAALGMRRRCGRLPTPSARQSQSSLTELVSLTFPFQFPYSTHSEWTIERHYFQAQYGESLKTIDDDLVFIHDSLDDLFAAVVRWTVCVFVRVSL